MRELIWSAEAYDLLYKNLVKLFGPCNSWKTKIKPEDSDGFDKFCKNFANSIGAKSGDAVFNQIRWAMTNQESVSGSHIKVFLSNKTLALKHGFIGKEQIPKTFLCEY